MNNFIAHYGVPGMHWGVRRFGVTDSGSRYKKARRAGVDKVEARRKVESENPGLAINSSKKRVDSVAGTIKEAKKINDTIAGARRKKVDLSHMTDQELKARVARMNLENQYNNLTSGEVSKGHAYVSKTLDVAGTVLAVGSSALGIAVAMKQLKGG